MRRTTQGFTLIEIMVVIAIIAGLVTTVAIVVPKMQESQRRSGCSSNLSGLGQMYLMQAQENRGKSQKYSGVAMWLSYRKNFDIKRGDEKAMVCMGDPVPIQLPESEDDKKKWDNVDLDNPRDDLCSYAARDFKNSPLNIENPDKEIIGCDRQGPNGRKNHHQGVIICVYEGGDVQVRTRSELGVASDADIVIGPESESKELRKVVYIVKKND